MADATMRVHERIGKPEHWDHIDHEVPFFTEHEEEVTDKDGKKVTIKIDGPRLHKILDKLLMLERTTGTLPVITNGHRVPIKNFPESQQPDILGIMANPRMGRFGPEKKLAIVGDPHYIKGKFEKAKENPFRSAEIYLPELDPETPYEDQLTAVALLKKDPRQNMGIVLHERPFCGQFSKDSQAYHFTMDTKLADPGGIDDEFEKHYMRCTRKCFPHMEAYHRDHMAKHYMQAASPTGVHVPALVGEEKEKKGKSMTMEREAFALERDAIVAQFQKELKDTVDAMEKKHQDELSKVAARVVQLETERAQLMADNSWAAFERELQTIAIEYNIDPAAELANAKEEKLAPEMFGKRCELLKRIAPKLPVAPFGARGGAPTAFAGSADPKALNGHKANKPVTSKMLTEAMLAAKPGEDVATAFQRINNFELPPQ